jgi:hypothetical protein
MSDRDRPNGLFDIFNVVEGGKNSIKSINIIKMIDMIRIARIISLVMRGWIVCETPRRAASKISPTPKITIPCKINRLSAFCPLRLDIYGPQI